MKQPKSNVPLYLLALAIILVTGNFVYTQFTGMMDVRRRQQIIAPYQPLHTLMLVVGEQVFADSDFTAAVHLTSLNDGNPIAAAMTVNLYAHQNNHVTPISGTFYTDVNGQGILEFALDPFHVGSHDLQIHVTSELGYEIFRRPLHISTTSEQNFIIHFDKGLYNPGDLVLFRVLALSSNNAQPIAYRDFTISIFDGNDNRVYYQTVQSSGFGIISGRFQLADEVNSGFYRLEVKEDNVFKADALFEVMPFVLPRFEVVLETDHEIYQKGETIYFSGHAAYFFGEPVNQGHVTIYINNERMLHQAALDENGAFHLSYIPQNLGRIHFWVEVIDNSNFRVEASHTADVTDGAFLIEVLPEHGYMVLGMPNTIYVFTHTVRGEPVRAFLQITGHGFSRQVATCENGIGMMVLDHAAHIEHISVHAVDMEQNAVLTEFTFNSVARNVTLRTNKPRFDVGEDIYLELGRRGIGGMFYIFAYRNGQLIKTLTSETDHVRLNLGEHFGLIDIYAVWISDANAHNIGARANIINSNDTAFARRTIFIDPASYMRFTIDSDREEYMPGEFVHLNFHVTDNHNNPLHAALLVNIVDEAMLAVAANDLSINNIRLALDGMWFGDNLDAATLYASLIAGASEQAITRILLRQDAATPRIFAHVVQNNPIVNMPTWSFFSNLGNFARLYVLVMLAAAFFVGINARRQWRMHTLAMAQRAAARKAAALDNVPVPNDASEHHRQSTEALLTALEDPAEKDASWTHSPKGRKAATATVFAMLILFVFATFFLTACAGNAGDAAPSATPAPAMVGTMPTPAPVATPGPVPTPSQPAAADVFTPNVQDAASEQQTMGADAQGETVTQTARVRRLFLETMLFVPELITHNGHADLSFILADNITTWNIQVVGNTQDGIVGHTQSSIRAFQPFFVDFELPRNSIRGDIVSIPVTVFNYTETDQSVVLTIADMDWFDLQSPAVQTLDVPSNQSVMVYVPIRITAFGNFVFRAYADAEGYADAAERPININPEGFRIRQVVSGGSIEDSTWRHLLFLNESIEDTHRTTISFYPSVMAQVVEGMENIFRMPFGCFEQTSSILYPNVLVLQYMQQHGLANPALTERALQYINSGYQRLLTFEVRGERGGFSLFGHAPAETVLTAYGLMQLHALSEVHDIDERVLYRMLEFLFRHQNNNGTFEITGRGHSHISDSQRLAFNAYIAWGISAAFPHDARLQSTVDYLLSQLTRANDNYTLALIANVLINTNHPSAQQVLERLAQQVTLSGNGGYVRSSTRDYFGAFGRMQYLQATALTSLAFSNSNTRRDLNDLFINYIISRRDSWGTWHSTQATILSLKALTAHNQQSDFEAGQIAVVVGEQEQVIEILPGSRINFYQVSFDQLERENIVDIRLPGTGRITYKITQEYFAPYDSVQLNRGFEVSSQMNTLLEVHELVSQNITIINTSGGIIYNGLVSIAIPQGFRVERNSLAMMVHTGTIERYEMRFDNINLYLRDTGIGEIVDLVVMYRPAFPAHITGGHVRVFDYYNPMIEGFAKPMEIIVR